MQLSSRSVQIRLNMPRDKCKPGMHTYTNVNKCLHCLITHSCTHTFSSGMSKKESAMTLLNSFALFRFPPAAHMKLLWSLCSVSRVRSLHLPLSARGWIKQLLVIWHHKQLWRPKVGCVDPNKYVYMCIPLAPLRPYILHKNS